MSTEMGLSTLSKIPLTLKPNQQYKELLYKTIGIEIICILCPTIDSYAIFAVLGLQLSYSICRHVSILSSLQRITQVHRKVVLNFFRQSKGFLRDDPSWCNMRVDSSRTRQCGEPSGLGCSTCTKVYSRGPRIQHNALQG